MKTLWSEQDIPDLSGRVAVITGANSGIGYETSRVLARHGMQVVMACRNMERAIRARSSILAENPHAAVYIMECDTSNHVLVRDFALQFRVRYPRLDLLVNNAGIMMAHDHPPELGYEVQFGVNHLGHFLLTGLLLDVLANTTDSRVLSLYSIAYILAMAQIRRATGQPKRPYSSLGAYSRSKLVNLIFAVELERRLKANHYTVESIAVHPGITVTKLIGHFNSRLYDTAVRPVLLSLGQGLTAGTLPILRAATDRSLTGKDIIGPDGFLGIRGNPVSVSPFRRALHPKWGRRLWDTSQRLSGIRYL